MRRGVIPLDLVAESWAAHKGKGIHTPQLFGEWAVRPLSTK